jgi:putative tryptophan/tyrosine transport system substrate-binding protein
MGILWHSTNPTAEFSLKETEAAAASVGLTPHVFAVRDPNEFSSSFSAMFKEHVDALIVGPSPMFLGQRERLAELAAKNRLPTLFTLGEYAQSGDLISYGPHYPDLFELVLNLKTARALGLIIPPSLLLRADQIIE